MKLNSGFLKCSGLCLAFCSALCLLAFLTACGTSPTSQTKQQQKMNEENTMQKVEAENESPFACMMNVLSPEEKKRTFALLDELKAKKQEVKELPDGYAFRYAMDAETFRNTAEFITYERLCCPFFDFELEVEREGGAMWLRLKGREGVKDFIRAEFSL